ncbi:tRNA(Ile)-lysidine synthetase [Gloeothece citriformis PCC 7424]|uniref:tRNA(Ile)-lysidine synthase n=1 Tax=Gloeothece citriformis (strain PCC 7424) TaxID=65393 RepID=B7KA43_GLOC7|nr:tRNA lysidine(34) synthetase TilS [Gloeothece citriformis]ACK71399.1 tRNA(Ile)-lysidine synthetase [Gloeothece citriformis PCC 7424]
MTWTNLHAKVHITLRKRQLLPKKERILVAVSGGQDSLCLLKLLGDLQPKWEWDLTIAHCDHQWPTDAGIKDHVQQIANQWKIPFYLKTADNLKETEAAARKWRYQALIEIAKEQGFSFIVTGHTKSDRAETFLYNLIRGAGTDGLSALTWERFLTENIKLVRPLLEISRAETYQFCQQFQLPIWEDVLNENFKYTRNRIRSQLIPYLQTHFNPQIEKTLTQTAEVLRAEVEYLEATAQEWLQKSITEDKLGINRTIVKSLPLALQRRVMRQFLILILSKTPNFEQIEALVNLIHAPNRSSISSLPGGKIIEVQGEWLNLKKSD